MNIFSTFSILASFVSISCLLAISACYGVYIHSSLKEPRFISCALNSHEMSVIVQPFVMITIFYFMYINQELKHNLSRKIRPEGVQWNILNFRLSITIGISAMMLFIVPMKFSVAVHGFCAGVTLATLFYYTAVSMRKLIESIRDDFAEIADLFNIFLLKDIYPLMMLSVHIIVTLSMFFILFDMFIVQREPFVLQTFLDYYSHIVECDKSINFFLNVGQALFAAAEFLALLCLAMLLVHMGYVLDCIHRYDERNAKTSQEIEEEERNKIGNKKDA